MTVEATPAGAKRAAWIATLQCKITGTDDGQRAEDLGRLIGGLFFLTGGLIMVYNLIQTVRSPTTEIPHESSGYPAGAVPAAGE